MGIEIERKFLIRLPGYFEYAESQGLVERHLDIKQGYLSLDPTRQVRVRVVREHLKKGGVSLKGYITIKGLAEGLSVPEYEYPIPFEEACDLLEMKVGHLVVKSRIVMNGWEIDTYKNLNAGLVVAEFELESPDQELQLPAWIGREVTGDSKYSNLHLAQRPYREWPSSGHLDTLV